MASSPPTRESKMENPLRLIKKYPNRRLYDTKTSSYITLADVKQMVLKQEEFQVVDAKSGEDLTRQILLQIILDEEPDGRHPARGVDAMLVRGLPFARSDRLIVEADAGLRPIYFGPLRIDRGGEGRAGT